MGVRQVPNFTLISAHADQPAPAVRVRRQSPWADYETWETMHMPTGPAPLSWSPLTKAVAGIKGWFSQAAEAGQRIIDRTYDELRDVSQTVEAAFTGNPPAEPGPIFRMATGAAESIARLTPDPVKRAIGIEPDTKIAGYITTSDGRKIPVPVGNDPVRVAENAQSELVKGALRSRDIDLAIEKLRGQLASRKLENDQDQFNRLTALKEREVAMEEDLHKLKTRAYNMALDRSYYSAPALALAGYASTIAPEIPTHRKVRQVGAFGAAPTIEELY